MDILNSFFKNIDRFGSNLEMYINELKGENPCNPHAKYKDILQLIFLKCSVQCLGRLAVTSKFFNVISCNNISWGKFAIKLLLSPKIQCKDLTFKEQIKNWKLSPNEVTCLALMELSPRRPTEPFLEILNEDVIFIEGCNCFAIEFKQACDSMLKGIPETFNSQERFPFPETWTYMYYFPPCNSAIEFLQECTKYKSLFREIIKYYSTNNSPAFARFVSNSTSVIDGDIILKEEKKLQISKNFPEANLETKMNFKELAENLEALLTRIGSLLPARTKSLSTKM